MKYVTLFLVAAASLFSATMQAQHTVPSGFSKAIVELNKGNVLNGYAKDNIKKSSSIIFIDSAGNKKVYDGNDINSLTIDTVHFICIRGDFFKIICAGKIDFLQKAGDASANPTYNGTEAMFTNGTAGSFFRINRHLLVNIEAVKKVHTWLGGRLKLEIAPATTAETIVSRERVNDFKEWLGR